VVAAALEIGVVLDAGQVETLEKFVALVERWNAKFNLLSRRDVDRLWTRHVLDSLSLLPLLPEGSVLDLGTGAGFPGIPLATADSARAFLLVDRSARKIRFLELAAHSLGLANVTCLCSDAARLSIPPVQAVVARAVSGMSEVWSVARRLLAPGGRLLVMTATRDPADTQSVVAAPEGACVERIVTMRIPGLDRPHEVTVLRARAPAPVPSGVVGR
jgi:16S rRNA (guanine527-N7)-methyltransferase